MIIIDYKSGLYKQKLEPFVSDDEPGSGYWRQAAIYRLLAEVNFPNRSRYEVRFHFIEQGKEEAYKEEVPEQFVEWMRGIPDQMRALYGA